MSKITFSSGGLLTIGLVHPTLGTHGELSGWNQICLCCPCFGIFEELQSRIWTFSVLWLIYKRYMRREISKLQENTFQGSLAIPLEYFSLLNGLMKLSVFKPFG